MHTCDIYIWYIIYVYDIYVYDIYIYNIHKDIQIYKYILYIYIKVTKSLYFWVNCDISLT